MERVRVGSVEGESYGESESVRMGSVEGGSYGECECESGKCGGRNGECESGECGGRELW